MSNPEFPQPNQILTTENKHAMPDTENWLKVVEPLHRHEAIHLRAEYGDAFDAYLEWIYVDHGHEIQDIRTDFTSHLLGSYDSLKHWANEYIDEQGWREKIDEVIDEHGMPEDIVSFNLEPILAMVSDRDYFEIIHYGGKVHLFWK